MLEWNDYIRTVLLEPAVFDNINLTINGERGLTPVPPIIKASIVMLDQIIAGQSKYNILVFPEKTQTAFIFALAKAIYNIGGGKVQLTYDPHMFAQGQKLKYKNCVMEFSHIESKSGYELIHVRFAEKLTYGLPIEIAPHLQLAETNRLSRFPTFASVFDVREAQKKKASQSADLIELLQNYRTHIGSSIFYVASILSTKEYLSGSTINGSKLQDVLLLSHANLEGGIKPLSAGQLTGNPAIVLAANLYAVTNAMGKGASLQSVIADISNVGIVESQLDAMDELMRAGIPITCVTDVANSFELQPLIDRGYNVWRWDQDSITSELYGVSNIISDYKTKHCAKRKIEYVTVDGQEISDSLRLLYSRREEVSDQSARMISAFDRLFSIAFTALRTVHPHTPSSLARMHQVLSDCEFDLQQEQRFISDEAYNDHSEVIRGLKKTICSGYALPKHDALAEHLLSHHYRNICIIVPDRTDKAACQAYWIGFCSREHLQTDVTVMYPSEYYALSRFAFNATVIVGWLNNSIMRKVLYSFNTETYVVLLYDYEKRWQKAHVAAWNRVLSNENNRTIIRKYLAKPTVDISTARFSDSAAPTPSSAADELGEVERILRENKYRQYVARGGQRAADTIEAVPVNFVGGYLSFYRLPHRIVTATDIIVNDDDKIVTTLPIELKNGDFVIVRESGRDLIKEIADRILASCGKAGLRDTAMKWKEALTLETVFSTELQIIQKFTAAGCKRSVQTIRGWLSNEDIISPQDRDDLESIALITEDTVLMEKIDEVYSAGREVKNAHVQAGKYLSDQLKQKIAAELQAFGEIDPFNIWEPITLQLENIGTVRILKVIDIGTPVVVDMADTNRLIVEG